MSGNYTSLSLSDLMLLDGFKEAYESDNKYEIYKHLWRNGIDINQKVELVFCTHRNLQNKVVECDRFEGLGRSDDNWLSSGAASVEDFIYSKDDLSFQREMLQISQQGYSWQDMCERLPKTIVEKEGTD